MPALTGIDLTLNLLRSLKEKFVMVKSITANDGCIL